MIILTYEEILRLAPKYDIIPICREVYANVVTPVTLLRRIARQSKRFFPLENIEGGERQGRYSSLGHDPVMRVTCKSGSVTIESSLREIPSRTLASGQPLQVIREAPSRSKSPSLKGQPPSTGGFAGHFAYAIVEYAEPVLHISRGNVNDLDLMPFDKITAHDHLKQRMEIVVNMRAGRTADSDPHPRETQYLEYLMKEYGRVCGKIKAITFLINQSSPLEKMTSPDKSVFTCNVSKEMFCHMVEKTEEYILDGDIFRVVISRQLTDPYKDSLLGAYQILRTTDPSPCMVYVNIDNDEIINTLPETLIRLKDGRLITFPVAGFRSRRVTPEEDRQLEKELLEDGKELSEYNMLADLGRSGIGKVVAFDSVEVIEYKMIHRYSKTMYTCSQVGGDIRSGLDGCPAIKTLLPAGTLSGVPKIRACQTTEELEQMPRRIYSGALGYLDFTGNLGTCTAICMAVKQGGKVTAQAEGGIVMDSVPGSEYEEPVNRTEVAINAIISAGEANDRWSS